jgi:hypothetical protein
MSTENKIEVHKIEIKIGDKTISLKPEQAKELKKILNEMFEEQKVVHHHHDHYRYWWHNYPYYGGTELWRVAYTSNVMGLSYTAQNQQGLAQNSCNTIQLALSAA